MHDSYDVIVFNRKTNAIESIPERSLKRQMAIQRRNELVTQCGDQFSVAIVEFDTRYKVGDVLNMNHSV